MSLGIHRLWKLFTIIQSGVQKGQTILDLAGGSGDLTRAFSQKVGKSGCVYLADINAEMLAIGRDKLLDAGLCNNIRFIQANAESLPFAENQFDCITMAFGLRNVTNKANALKSMYRVLKPGGKLLILEFSTPTVALIKPLYDWYSFQLLPKLGKFFANDEDSYRYLAESIRMHPSQEALKTMIEHEGFEDCTFHNLSAGIVALHCAYKY
jgi:demethylmenaquinone methyltransferase/2-methoxy-6-polyprenyl-1,4-benzoquinol methylase